MNMKFPMVEDILDIPEDLIHEVPCQVHPELYTDPALDVDLDDTNFLDLTLAEQQALVKAKNDAEEKATDACYDCPIMDKCREWALRTNVFGPAGGLTEMERAHIKGENIPEFNDLISRGPRRKVRGDVIARWSEQGMSTQQIANYLHASPRTVERYRAAMAVNAPAPSPSTVASAPSPHVDMTAKQRMNFKRLSRETLAMYEALADGAVRSRDEILSAGAPFVSNAVALNTARNMNVSRAKRIEAGKRKFLLNRLDIAIRRGRIHAAKSHGTVVLCLDKEVRGELTEWLEENPCH